VPNTVLSILNSANLPPEPDCRLLRRGKPNDTVRDDMAKPVRILSIDGGGVRGLIPSLVLTKLEQLAGRPIFELFDLIAGTSTGGILALGLTMAGPNGRPAHSAHSLVSIYEKESARIFSRPLGYRLRALGSLADQKYPSQGIEAVLLEYFQEARLKDSLTDVLIPAYEIERHFPFFFKSAHARLNPAYDFAIRDVARATSAAPTYFEPHRIAASGSDGDYFALVDGGVYANNPAGCALVECLTRYPSTQEFVVVSLGTGVRHESISYGKSKAWGVAQWAKPIFNIVLDGVSATVDYQLKQLLPSKRYFRFQPNLEKNCAAMDKTNPDNIRRLRLTADTLIREKMDDLKILSGLLAQY
jgi:uncharacterized protein